MYERREGKILGGREKTKKTDRMRKRNKKFLEELIAYFRMIRQGSHRKRRLQKFFVTVRTC
jgi:hypothetical protein